MLLRSLSSIVFAQKIFITIKIVSCPSLNLVHKQYSFSSVTKYINNPPKYINNPLKYINNPPKYINNNRTFSSHSIKLVKDKVTDVSKEKIIQTLNFHCYNDASPFYNLPLKTLLQIYKTTQKDKKNGFCENRLYYISNKIKCQPSLLSKRIVKRTFLYDLSFEWLENSLTVLLDMNVSGDRILRDLWVLKYHHKTIEERLLRVKNSGIDTLFPWMVRCSEDILSRFIQISQETKSILGEYQSTKVYLAKRLNTSPEVIEDIYVKIPALKTIRVTKAKNFIDFLISEGFEVEEIINKSRIFSASQNTVKQRLERLRKLGRKSINLNVLCRSRKDFQKYCESIETISKEQ